MFDKESYHVGVIPVTDEMVAAARRQIPERWGLGHVRDALVAAFEIAEQQFDPTHPLRDFEEHPLTEAELREFTEAVNEAMGRPLLVLTSHGTVEPFVTADGLEGEGVRDATGSLATIPVNYPIPHGALAEPLVLGGITEIATRLEVARSTVVGWIKRAEKIGMPAPLAVLAAGPVFDLVAVETWYRAWKAGDADDETDQNT